MIRTDSLYVRYTARDITKNWMVSIALTVVLTLSAFLMATGAMVMERLVGAIGQLFEQAAPPHFLQMHKGEYHLDALERFADEHTELDSWQIVDLLGFDGAAIGWERPSSGESGDLSASLIDNLFVVQNPDFDFLIDQNGEIARPAASEVYVPVAYQQQFGLQLGDELRIRTDSGVHPLTVQGFVRDAQMASSLSSSTRFLVSADDFQALRDGGGGSTEIIAEYLLSDDSLTSELQRAYEADEALPKNGQAVTFEMIRIINAISDGLVAIALVFISLLLVAIALINLRFVIRGTLEDEVRQIGALKAIGIPARAIGGLYLTKYSVMTVVACVLGGLLAIGATTLLTQSIQVNYAQAPLDAVSIVVPLLALAIVYLFVVIVCRGVLRGVQRIQVVGAMVHGTILGERQTARRALRLARRARRSNLASLGALSVNARLALIDLRAEAGQWLLVPVVFFLAAVLMALPSNLLSTFESPRFVTYLGAPESDLRADLQYSDNIDEQRQELLAVVHSDTRLTDVRVFANALFEAESEEGWETLRVEVGDPAQAALEYARGEAPQQGQIALSVLNADKFAVDIGDTLSLRREGSVEEVAVSGIFQDVTNGGYTAKLPGEITSGAVGYVVFADLAEGADNDAQAITAEYDARFPDAQVLSMREYVQQTLSYVTDAFRAAAIVSLVFGVAVAVLITSLFLKLRLTRDRQKIGVLSALGFSAGEIIGQARLKALLTVVLGAVLGFVFAATAGQTVVGALIALAGLGIEQLTFIPNPLLVYLVYPLVLIAAGYLGAVVLTSQLRTADKNSWIKG